MRRHLLILGIALLAGLLARVLAQEDAVVARQLHESGRVLSLEYFVRRAQSLLPGTLVDARLREEPHHSSWVYEIFMLDAGGRIWEIEFDAGTGELIEHQIMR